MTLTSATERLDFDGDGSTTSFPITYVFWDADDLQVVHRDTVLGTDTIWVRGTQYTVSGGNGSTGSIEVITSPTDYTPASTDTLTVRSNLALTQTHDIVVGGALNTDALERALDQIVRQIQQLRENQSRTPRFRVTTDPDVISDTALLPQPASGQILRWHADEDGELENTTIATLTPGTVGVPVAVADGGTGATGVTAARNNLAAAGTGAANTFTAAQTFSAKVTISSAQIVLAKGADVASATALTLGTDGNAFDVTGTVTVTSIGTLGVGTVVILHFDGALTFTHHATDLILPGGANITTAAGDIATLYEYATGDWRCIGYSRASGLPIIANEISEARNYFESSEQTVTADTLLQVAHGLGAVPKSVEVYLRCKTTDAGYSANDEIKWSSTGSTSATTDYGATVSADATNVEIIQGAAIEVLGKATFNAAGLTVGNWRWIVRAWL